MITELSEEEVNLLRRLGPFKQMLLLFDREETILVVYWTSEVKHLPSLEEWLVDPKLPTLEDEVLVVTIKCATKKEAARQIEVSQLHLYPLVEEGKDGLLSIYTNTPPKARLHLNLPISGKYVSYVKSSEDVGIYSAEFEYDRSNEICLTQTVNGRRGCEGPSNDEGQASVGSCEASVGVGSAVMAQQPDRPSQPKERNANELARRILRALGTSESEDLANT
ncbi:hypothetical protein EG329_003755 [Mollisiaceae sp. DMI_Dod_QoI]|nr:hypothetical protein EG329_003755 [Helotiales sp. DMI_Dod_QoI]